MFTDGFLISAGIQKPGFFLMPKIAKIAWA
jgi:hypothetical protein